MKTSYGEASRTDADVIEIDGVLCFRSEERPDLWLYVPGPPQPELVNGRPSLHLYASRDGGVLQLGSQWAVTPQQHEKLQRQLRISAEEVDLQPAPATVQQAVVEAADERGARIPLASSQSSGFPPHTALFRVSLTDPAKTLITAALHGREDFLFVRYHVVATLRVAARAVLTADIVRAGLDPSLSRKDIEAWLENGIKEGTVTLDVDAGASPQVRKQAVERAKELFVGALEARTRPAAAIADSSILRIEASASALEQREFDREADVSKWFPAGTGQQFVTVV